MWTQGTLNAAPIQVFRIHFHMLRLTTVPVWWWIPLVSCLISYCDVDTFLFAFICAQYWVIVCYLNLSAWLQCVSCSMKKKHPFSCTLKAPLTQHSDFTVIVVLSKASWGHHMQLQCKSIPLCSSTSQLANSAPLLQDSEDFLCKTTKIKQPLP